MLFRSLCLEFIDELRRLWKPQVHLMRNVSDDDRALMNTLAEKWFMYDRPGHNRWPVLLGTDGEIIEGYGPNEHLWWCERGCIQILGIDGKRKAVLAPTPQGVWESQRCALRNMHIRLKLLPA